MINDKELENLSYTERQIILKAIKDECLYSEIQELIYKHENVPIEKFIDDPQYLGSGDEIWQKIKEDLYNIYSNNYKEVIIVAGIGSGKSTLTALALGYELFQIGRLWNPQRYYGIKSRSKIAVMNMSIRAMQAKDVLFDFSSDKITGL